MLPLQNTASRLMPKPYGFNGSKRSLSSISEKIRSITEAYRADRWEDRALIRALVGGVIGGAIGMVGGVIKGVEDTEELNSTFQGKLVTEGTFVQEATCRATGSGLIYGGKSAVGGAIFGFGLPVIVPIIGVSFLYSTYIQSKLWKNNTNS